MLLDWHSDRPSASAREGDEPHSLGATLLSRVLLRDISAEPPLTEAMLCEGLPDARWQPVRDEIDAANAAITASPKPLERCLTLRCGEATRRLKVTAAAPADAASQRLIVLRDVTEEHRLEEALRRANEALREYRSGREAVDDEVVRLAYNDPLTDLPNRRAFDLALKAACATGEGALCLIDLDRFKAVNDALGHTIGDRLLQAVAARLRSHTRQGDFVARLGGDEFAVLLQDIGSREDAYEAAQRLAGAFAARLDLGEVDVQASATTGVALVTAGEDPAAVFRRADTAMHQAKRRRRGTIAVSGAEASVLSEHADLMLVKSLLDAGSLALAFRPIVDPAGATIAREAMVVREGAEGLSFDAIGATAQQFGLGLDLALKVLCELAHHAESQAPCVLRLPPALAAEATILEGIARWFADSGLPNRAIALELPLASLTDETAAEQLAAIAAAGAGVVIGDWDMSVAAFHRAAQPGVMMVKLELASIAPMLGRETTAAVCRSAFDGLRASGTLVCIANIATARMAERVFALGATAATGPAFAAQAATLTVEA